MARTGIMALQCRIDDSEVNACLSHFERYSVHAQGAINDAVRKAVREIAKRARRRAPVGVRATGKHLKNTIKTKVKKAKFGGLSSGETYTAAPHAHLIELGVKSHSLKPKHQAMRIDANGMVRFVSGTVRHPGFGARPFLRPSFQEYKDTFVRDIKEAVK